MKNTHKAMALQDSRPVAVCPSLLSVLTVIDSEVRIVDKYRTAGLASGLSSVCIVNPMLPMLNTFTVSNLSGKKFTTSLYWYKHGTGFRSEMMLDICLGKRQRRAVCSSQEPFWFSNAS